MVRFTIDAEEVEVALRSKALRVLEALREKLDSLDEQVAELAREKASGEVLKVRSGNLRESIEKIPAEIEGDTIIGGVRAGGDKAPYLKFQEEGTRGPYEIVPVNKKALMFYIESEQIFAKHVTHPGLPARPVLSSAFDEMRDEIISGLQETLREVLAES